MYYALPYVPNPIEHKSFKHLFTQEFHQQIKLKLVNFIETNLKKIPGDIEPQLIKQ